MTAIARFNDNIIAFKPLLVLQSHPLYPYASPQVRPVRALSSVPSPGASAIDGGDQPPTRLHRLRPPREGGRQRSHRIHPDPHASLPVEVAQIRQEQLAGDLPAPP